MPIIHIRHTGQLVLALEEGVVFDQQLVNDLDLISEGNITMTYLDNYNFGSYFNHLIIPLHFYCFRKLKT